MTDQINAASRASAWEAVCIVDTRKTCEILAQRTYGLERAGMTAEDMVQMLQMEVIVACRNWAQKSAEKPPKAFLRRAILRRQSKIWDKCKRAQSRDGRLAQTSLSRHKERRKHGDPREFVTVETTELLAVNDTTYDDQDRLQALQAVEQVVGMVVAPKDFAIMRLKASGWKGDEIANSIGMNRKQVFDRITRSRKKAREFLRACGIEGMQEAELLDVEIMENVWKRAERRHREGTIPSQ